MATTAIGRCSIKIQAPKPCLSNKSSHLRAFTQSRGMKIKSNSTKKNLSWFEDDCLDSSFLEGITKEAILRKKTEEKLEKNLEELKKEAESIDRKRVLIQSEQKVLREARAGKHETTIDLSGELEYLHEESLPSLDTELLSHWRDRGVTTELLFRGGEGFKPGMRNPVVLKLTWSNEDLLDDDC